MQTNYLQTGDLDIADRMLLALADGLDPEAGQASDDYKKFQARYWDDPAGFANDCLIFEEGEKLTDYQIEGMKRLVKHKRFSMRGPHGLGKCLGYNESMRLYDGRIVKAHELIGKSFDVLAVDENLRVVKATAFAKDNGVKDVIEIVTDKGRVIRRTLNHPLWADNQPVKYSKPEFAERLRPDGKWIPAGELTVNSVVAVFLGNDGVKGVNMPDEAIKLTAYLLGDGGLTSGIKFSQEDNVILHEFIQCCNYFGCEVLFDEGCTYRVVTGRRGGRKTNPIIEMMRQFGLYGKNSYEKSFPYWVWMLDNRQLSLFVSRLFSCDGWAHGSIRHDGKVTKEIGFSTVSKQMALDMNKALLRLGVQAENRSRTAKSQLGTSVIAYTVSVHDSENIILYCDRVGIFGKEEAVKNVYKLATESSSLKTQKWRHYNLPDNMAWEKIKSITVIENEPTIAITVPSHHTFVTDFVEHNTAFAAIIVLWFVLTRDGQDWKVPMLASAWRQLTKFLAPEIHKWARRLRWDMIGRKPFNKNELLQLNLRLSTGEAFAIASDNAAYIEGAHAKHMLYVFDESKVIPDETWDAAEGAFSTGECFWLAISTPGEMTGRFYDIHSHKSGYEDWNTLFVTLDMAIKAGRINQEWAEQRKKQWGEDSSVYKNRVLGEFASVDDDGVISLADIERSNIRWLDRKENEEYKELTGVGVDIGRGGDPSVLAHEYDDNFILELEERNTRNSMEIAGRIVTLLRKWTSAVSVIDIGYDPGVYDRVKEDDRCRDRAMPFIASGATEFMDETGELRFSNERSAAWWNLRELLKNDEYDLPPDDKLTGELTAPKFKLMSGGKIQVEGKGETVAFGAGLRKRLKRSTDHADPVVQIAFKHNLRMPDDNWEGFGNVEDASSRWK